jgi:hypothetical protein
MLFKPGDFTSTAGKLLSGKIECDAFDDEDWEWCADIIRQTTTFNSVIGVPRGGLKLAKALEKYADPKSYWELVVDDVYTTGKSITPYFKKNSLGFVVFNRGRDIPSKIYAIFHCCDRACWR